LCCDRLRPGKGGRCTGRAAASRDRARWRHGPASKKARWPAPTKSIRPPRTSPQDVANPLPVSVARRRGDEFLPRTTLSLEKLRRGQTPHPQCDIAADPGSQSLRKSEGAAWATVG